MKQLFSLMLAMVMLVGGAAWAEAYNLGDVTVPEGTQIQVDLNGDGVEESFFWKSVPVGEYDLEVILEIAEADGSSTTWNAGVLYNAAVYICPVDEDSVWEIFLSGDEMSEDYVTWCLNYGQGELNKLYFPNINRGENDDEWLDACYGAVTALSNDGRIRISGWQDVLGTYLGTRELTMVDGRFELNDDMWVFERDFDDLELWEYQALKLIAPLDVALVSDELETQATLTLGTRLVITRSDKTSVAYFRTEGGKEGYVRIEPNEELGWGMLVNGMPEEAVFEYVPYAG